MPLPPLPDRDQTRLFEKLEVEAAWKLLGDRSGVAVGVIDAAFEYAADRDVIIVLAAGNHDREVTEYPGDAESTVIVGHRLSSAEQTLSGRRESTD